MPNLTRPSIFTIRLGVDPRKADQMIRGAVVLPNGFGQKRCASWFSPKAIKPLRPPRRGADHVGADDLVEKIKGGWFDFDAAIATPDMMGVWLVKSVSFLGRVA